MINSRPSEWIDWILTTLRWLFLVGMAVAVAIQDRMSLLVALALLAAALWNFLLTVWASLGHRLPAHRLVNLAGDLLISYLLFFLSGGITGSLSWVGVLPLITTSLYFSLRSTLLIALLNLAVQGLIGLISAPPAAVLLFVGTLAPLYLVLSLLFSYLNHKIIQRKALPEKQTATNDPDPEREQSLNRQVIFNLISELTSSLNYQRVLDTALDLSASAITEHEEQADKLVGAVLLFSKQDNGLPELQVGSARHFTPTDLRICLPGTAGLIGRSIDNGEPHLSKDPANDPELGRIIALRACQSAYSIPLRLNLDTYGVLLFAHPEPDFFTAERREILDIVGNQSVIAIQNARLYQDLEQEKERMMAIQEESRKKLARDLHDGPTQSVAAIAMRVNFARRLIERDAKAAADEMFKIEELARRTTKEIRHMLFTLRPLVLESQGLSAALGSMADKMHETYGQNVIIQSDQRVVEELEMGKQGVIFYIAEEAVNNARKHARAAHIWVRLKQAEPDLALLEVEDDGVGFDLKATDANYENRGSLGMVNMRERAELVNGLLQIDSAVGKGTRIRLLIPLSEAAADRIRRGL